MDSQYDSPQGQGLDLDLEEFTGKLDPYQWRLLRDILNARSFDYDIIGNLPLELVIQVFRHLDPVTPFLHQRVCKQWQKRLTTPEVMGASLSQWYASHDPPLVVRGGAKTERDACYMRLEHIQRFRTGQHRSFVELVFSPQNPLTPTAESEVYDSYKYWLAWSISGSDGRIIALDLKLDRPFYFYLPGRTLPLDLKLSDDLLFVHCLNSTTHYACHLETRECRMFRLPHTHALSFAVAGLVVACLMGHPPRQRYCLVVWSYNTRKTLEFPVSLLSEHMTPESLIMSPGEESITIIHRGAHKKELLFGFQKYSYDGVLLATSWDGTGFERSASGEHLQIDYLSTRNLYFSATRNTFGDIYNISSCLSSQMAAGGEEICSLEHFEYNARTMTFRQLDQHTTSPDPESSAFIRWQDTFVKMPSPLHLPSFLRYTTISDGQVQTHQFPRDHEVSQHSFDLDRVFLSDRCLVHFGPDSVKVWSFDPGLDLSHARSDYTPDSMATNPIPLATFN